VQFVIKRVLAAIPVVFLTSVIIFSLMRLLPGDPITVMAGQSQSDASPELLQQLRHQYGFDRPVYVQYGLWVQRALSGDLGYSVYNRLPVWDVLRPRILPTAQIGLTAWILAILVSLPLGAYTAVRMNSWVDWLGTALALIGAAMPYFLTGGLFIYFVAMRGGMLPASGFVSPFVDFWQSIRTTILPALTLTFALIAVLTRQARSSFAETMQLAYIRTARAKGLGEGAVVFRHAAQNAILPVVTILGLQLGSLFSGAVVTETVFAVPGVGRLLVDAILSRDYAVVQAVVLFITLAVVLANLLVDIAYGLLDPRIKQS
jgi:peptide/nickel transport system permease protein